MKILVTGAKGFVGKNLCWALKNIQAGKDKTHPGLKIDEVFEYDIDSEPKVSPMGGDLQGAYPVLDAWCRECDFVFNLAGVNRPKEQSEFMEGNFGFASTLLDTLKKYGNRCPVMLSSSQQASLTGRFGNSEYGRSKKAGENLFLDYEREFLKANTNYTNETNCEDDVNTNDRELSINKGLRPRVLIYRFPNLFGKWCRPNYNSAVATFCHNIANDLPIQVNDPSVELELLYIDDMVAEMLDALEGKEHRCEFEGLEVIPTTNLTNDTNYTNGDNDLNTNDHELAANGEYDLNTNDHELAANGEYDLNTNDHELAANGQKSEGRYCYCPITHKVTLGEIVSLLHTFARNTPSLGEGRGEAPVIPEIPSGSFAKKLYSTYLSYLPKEKVAFPLKMNVDDRGSFTELVHTLNSGQVSINISKPGITKGQHWHNTKWEFFIVVAGHGLIQERKIGTDEVIEFEVSGDNIQCIHMLPGYTHNIINLSETENLVTVMYCNEIFDPSHPDTFFEKV